MLENCTWPFKTLLAKSSAVQKKYCQVTPFLNCLSWLPVKDQLYHLQAVMAFQCMTVNILHPNLLPVSKLANEQPKVAKN